MSFNEPLTSIEDVFKNAINRYPDDHDMAKAIMVKNGVPFSSVTRIFNKLMIKSGRAMTDFEKKTVIKAVLGKGGFKTETAFNDKVEKLMDKLNVSKRSASATVRAYATKMGKEYYKPPVKTTPPRKSFMKTFCEFLESNPDATEAEVMTYLNDGTATYIKRNLNLYMEVWRMLQNVLRDQRAK